MPESPPTSFSGSTRRRPRLPRLSPPVRHWLRHTPTALTLGNSLCGFAAILHTLKAYEAYALNRAEEIPQILAGSAWLILGAMIFDMLDGWTARKLDASSDHGVEMDSLADMVTFGVAPAVLVAVMAHTYETAWLSYRVVWVLSAVYLGCVALRLALYNVMSRQPRQGPATGAFHGLPSPGGAAAVCSLVILNSKYQIEYKILAELLPIYAGILGLLMISPIPYLHMGKWLGGRRYYQAKILLLIVFFLAFAQDPKLMAALATLVYIFSGPIKVIRLWAAGESDPLNRPGKPPPAGGGTPPPASH